VGGVILFVSAMCWVGVLVGTMLVMPRGARGEIEYAEPMVVPAAGASVWDRLGLWTAVAVVLIIVAYAQPLYHLHTMARFPSRGFSPF
jgi:cytochrome c oxidase subunit 1